MKRQIRGSAVVIIGATSGIGRATARSLASIGADLILAARDEHDVEEVVAECRALGATAYGVTLDNADPADVQRLVDTAVGRLGRIDTWINAASALVVGELVDQPAEDIVRLVQTNVLGTTFASKAALRYFRDRDEGVLINVSSLLALAPNPLVPTYVMTKYAVRGLTLSLHEAVAGTPIRVCAVLPGPTDTPIFRRAANYSGRAVRAIPPAQSAERAAAAIIRSVRRPRRQRTVGAIGAAIMLGHHVAPRLVETLVARTAASMLLQSTPEPPSSGSLFTTRDGADVTGGWRRIPLRARTGDAVGRFLARRAA